MARSRSREYVQRCAAPLTGAEPAEVKWGPSYRSLLVDKYPAGHFSISGHA